MNTELFNLKTEKGQYRATARNRPNGTVVVRLWGRNSAEGSWTELNGSSLVPDLQAAERLAVRKLEGIIGITLELAPDPISVEWIRTYSGDPNAEILDPQTVETETHTGERINGDMVISLCGMYLVREPEEPFEWWMGSKVDEGKIACWGTYGTSLSRAIDSL